LISQALEKLEAFARCVFFPIGFVVGTVPTAHSFNDNGFPMIHPLITMSCGVKTRALACMIWLRPVTESAGSLTLAKTFFDLSYFSDLH
jgi:hypothetical protein